MISELRRQAAREGGARLLREHRKRRGIANGEVRENLAIDFDAGLLEPVHEDAVAHVVLMGRRVDAHDPERRKSRFLFLRSR